MADEKDDDTEDGAEGGEAKKKGIPKLFLFGGLGALIVILGGVAAALLLLGGGDGEAHTDEHGGEPGEEHGGEHGEATPLDPSAQVTAYFDQFEQSEVYSVTLNIADENGRTLVMSLKFAITFTDHSVATVIAHPDFRTRLTDMMIDFGRTLRVEDLNGSYGNYRVRAEILRRINLLIAPLAADEVLITEMITG